jgi:hypothetical protein
MSRTADRSVSCTRAGSIASYSWVMRLRSPAQTAMRFANG